MAPSAALSCRCVLLALRGTAEDVEGVCDSATAVVGEELVLLPFADVESLFAGESNGELACRINEVVGVAVFAAVVGVGEVTGGASCSLAGFSSTVLGLTLALLWIVQ